MSNLVLTTKGLIEMDELVVTYHTGIGDNYSKVATEFRYQGELVKRDVSVSMLRGLNIESIGGVING